VDWCGSDSRHRYSKHRQLDGEVHIWPTRSNGNIGPLTNIRQIYLNQATRPVSTHTHTSTGEQATGRKCYICYSVTSDMSRPGNKYSYTGVPPPRWHLFYLFDVGLLWPPSAFTQPLWIFTGRSSVVVSMEMMIITTDYNDYIIVDQSSTSTFNQQWCH